MHKSKYSVPVATLTLCVSLISGATLAAHAETPGGHIEHATYRVNGQAVMTGNWLTTGVKHPVEYMSLVDFANLAMPTLHLESTTSSTKFNLTSMWEPNVDNVLSGPKARVGRGEVALALNGHPYVVTEAITQKVKGKSSTYVPVTDVMTFLQRSLNVNASTHGTSLSFDIGKTLFQYPEYSQVKRGQAIPIYDSGQILMQSLPQTTKMPAHSPWRASPLGVASAYAWNIVPPGYGWYWPDGSSPEKSVKNTATVMESRYRGERVEFSLERTRTATKSTPALANVLLTVGKTTYLMQLFRPRFTYEWALYDVLEYPGVK